jgi:hypothetical protein
MFSVFTAVLISLDVFNFSISAPLFVISCKSVTQGQRHLPFVIETITMSNYRFIPKDQKKLVITAFIVRMRRRHIRMRLAQMRHSARVRSTASESNLS